MAWAIAAPSAQLVGRCIAMGVCLVLGIALAFWSEIPRLKVRKWMRVAVAVLWAVAVGLETRGIVTSSSVVTAAPGLVTIIRTEVPRPVKDGKGLHPLANVYFQNGGTAGKTTHTGVAFLTDQIYSTDDVAMAARVRTLAAKADASPLSSITPHEQQWFTVLGEAVHPSEFQQFLAGRRALYFAGTITVQNEYGERRTPYCAYALFQQTFLAIHQCDST